MRTLTTGTYTQADKWEDGKVVAGYLMSIDTIPGCDSRKVNLDKTGKADVVSVWETAALKMYLSLVKVGEYIIIECGGKQKIKGKDREAWTFDVHVLEGKEIEDYIKTAKLPKH